MRCRGWRSRTSTSTASTTRANGPTPASARSSRPRASSSPSGPEKAAGMLPPPDLRLSIEPLDGDVRAGAGRGRHGARRGAAAVTAPARRRALRAMGRLVLLLGAPRLARGANGAAIVAVRVWPAAGLHAHHHRVRRPAGGDAPDGRGAPPAGRRHRRPGTPRRTARTRRQGAARRPLHRRRARRPVPAPRRAAGVRPQAGGAARAVHAGAGGGLPAPAGVRPLPGAGGRPAAGADPRQGGRRGTRRAGGAGCAGRADRAHRAAAGTAAGLRHPPRPRRCCPPPRRPPRGAVHAGPAAARPPPPSASRSTASSSSPSTPATAARTRAPSAPPGCARRTSCWPSRCNLRDRLDALPNTRAMLTRDADYLRAAARARAQGAARAGRPLREHPRRRLHAPRGARRQRLRAVRRRAPAAPRRAGWRRARTRPTRWAASTWRR